MPFPLHPRKHARPALFTAEDFLAYAARRGSSRTSAPRTVILSFSPAVAQRVITRTRARRARGRSRLHILGHGPRAIGLAEARGVGGPSLSVTVEELAAAGARRFVVVGFAGAVRPELPVGSYVLCTRALRDEGTSYHYARPSRWAYASPELTGTIGAYLERAGVLFRRGSSWTIDAPYRETVEELRAVRRAGVLTVEMEASALFAIARARGVDAAAVFAVSDRLDETGWTPRFDEARPALDRLHELVYRALIAAPGPAQGPRRGRTRRAGGKAQ